MLRKTIITAAITGAVHLPSMSEFLPLTPEHIIDEAAAAAGAGAAVVHLHARDSETGRPSSDPAVMKQIVDGVRKRCDVIVGITTGGAIGMTIEERLASVPVCKAELASCNAGSVNFCFSPIADKIVKPKYDWEIPFVKSTYSVPFANTFKDIEDYVRVMNENGVKPEFEVYEVGMLSNISFFVNRGIIKPPVYLQFVLGVMGGLPATVDNLLFLYNTAKGIFGDGLVWSCAAAGKNQFDMVAAAMLLGGNMRVGLEDNLYLSRGVLAKSNAEPVAKACEIVKLMDREVATADQARDILGLK